MKQYKFILSTDQCEDNRNRNSIFILRMFAGQKQIFARVTRS